MRPGRAVITATRVESDTASCRLWVTKITVLRVRRQISSSHSPISTRVCSSSAPNGSSMRTIFVSSASARAMATRWRMPPDSSRGYFSAKGRSPSGPSRSLAMRRRSARATPRSSSPNSTFPSAVRHGKRPGSWKTVATRVGSGPDTDTPSTRTRPSSGVASPPIIASSVDLPQPDGPMIVQNWPSPTLRETSRSASTVPERVTYRLPTRSAAMSSGGGATCVRILDRGHGGLRAPPKPPNERAAGEAAVALGQRRGGTDSQRPSTTKSRPSNGGRRQGPGPEARIARMETSPSARNASSVRASGSTIQ